jgi:hypothetical protein
MSLGAKRSLPAARVTQPTGDPVREGGAWAGAGRADGVRPGAVHRYWPVLATVSIDRPASVPCLPEISVLM